MKHSLCWNGENREIVEKNKAKFQVMTYLIARAKNTVYEEFGSQLEELGRLGGSQRKDIGSCFSLK